MRIGLGLAALGRPGYLNLGHAEDLPDDRSVESLEAHTHTLCDAAYEAGVRAFDTARSYGLGERFLGSWLRSRGPEGVTISSKWGYVYVADWQIDVVPGEVKHHDAETFHRQLAETREELGDALDLYQIHSATPDSGVLDNEAVLDGLRELRADGVRIGISLSGPSQGATLDQALGLDLFDSVQATWNLFERSAGDALARAHDAGLVVYVKEGVANGRLAGREDVPPLAAVAAETRTTPDAVALAAVLAQPWADVVLSGAASLATLRQNLAALEVDSRVARDGRLAGLASDPADYWETRSGLVWN